MTFKDLKMNRKYKLFDYHNEYVYDIVRLVDIGEFNNSAERRNLIFKLCGGRRTSWSYIGNIGTFARYESELRSMLQLIED